MCVLWPGHPLTLPAHRTPPLSLGPVISPRGPIPSPGGGGRSRGPGARCAPCTREPGSRALLRVTAALRQLQPQASRLTPRGSPRLAPRRWLAPRPGAVPCLSASSCPVLSPGPRPLPGWTLDGRCPPLARLRPCTIPLPAVSSVWAVEARGRFVCISSRLPLLNGVGASPRSVRPGWPGPREPRGTFAHRPGAEAGCWVPAPARVSLFPATPPGPWSSSSWEQGNLEATLRRGQTSGASLRGGMCPPLHTR